VLQAIGDVQNFRDDRDAALKSYGEALQLFRAVGARLGEANVLQAIGDVQNFRDDRDAALKSYGEALQLFRAVGARLGEANVLKAIGDVQNFRDDRDAALKSYGEALQLFRAVGARLGEANVLKAIGDVQNFRDDRDAALKSYGEALQLFRAVGDRLGEANVLQAIGDVQNFRKEIDAALKSYGEALQLFRAVGDRLGEANVLASQGKMYVLADPDRANELLNQALAIYQRIGSRYSIPAQIGNFGWELLRLGESDRARPYLLQAADLFEEMGLMDYAERHRRAAAGGDDGQQAFAQFLADVVAGARGDEPCGQRAYKQAQELQGAQVPVELQAIGRACQRLLEGLRGDDVLRDLPEEIKPLIAQLLAQIEA
jgi:tetratricopeptide (TPR) repeat protein